MLRTRILKEEKWFKIESKPVHLIGHGYSETIDGIVFCDKPYKSYKDCQQEMQTANKCYTNINTWYRPNKPELTIYWKVLDEQISDGK